ncbi:TetR/AcrR family transcriptional regulator [Lutibacter sp. HS1-25]|uniref:TetR/AcrR family transcriptional regulator n=1 Tax=Lutibacter sp. HS1-25 TaxID=2485000 RepID=UPI00101392A8|nr:TetR/AcrR family transcriptional regulator [Lutibacter sp. HS1-25]RXP61893.1 TetR/AcrR family transcriptional regulator [Lutibacter sp. HS1-25]
MDKLLSNIRIEIPQGIYLKDPESSSLGKKIIKNSIVLIEEIGFEDFNFKKLGQFINSNESSIYRYFESKHKLLMYLTSWYWSWIEYQLVMETYSVNNAEEKLLKAINVVTRTTEQDNKYSHINEVLLNLIMINESSKSFLTKNVDIENNEGYFSPYKRVVQRISDIIKGCNNSYPFPLSLASTVIEGALHQQFLKVHFKSITNCDNNTKPTDFFTNLILNTLSNGA